jgi:hypothetical protein
MPPSCPRHRRLGQLLTVATIVPTLSLTAQSGAALGIRGIGSASVTASYAMVERDANAYEIGAALDLGHFQSRRVRLGAVASFLRTRPYREFVESEDSTYRDVFFDLSGHVVLTLLAREPQRRVVPYASFGVGVHALTSNFGSVPLDLRYNTNVLGLRSATGVRLRSGPRGRRGATLESSVVLAKEVSRVVVGLSFDWLLGDLVQR